MKMTRTAMKRSQKTLMELSGEMIPDCQHDKSPPPLEKSVCIF